MRTERTLTQSLRQNLYASISGIGFAGTFAFGQYAAVTSSMFGLLTIVLAWALQKERMTAIQWGGCIVAFCGVGYLAL